MVLTHNWIPAFAGMTEMKKRTDFRRLESPRNLFMHNGITGTSPKWLSALKPYKKPSTWDGFIAYLRPLTGAPQLGVGTSQAYLLTRLIGLLGRDVLDDLAGLQTGRADGLALGDAVFENPHPLEIRHPPAVGQVVGMRYVVARHRLLSANFANFGHGIYQLLLTKSPNICTNSQKTR